MAPAGRCPPGPFWIGVCVRSAGDQLSLLRERVPVELLRVAGVGVTAVSAIRLAVATSGGVSALADRRVVLLASGREQRRTERRIAVRLALATVALRPVVVLHHGDVLGIAVASV